MLSDAASVTRQSTSPSYQMRSVPCVSAGMFTASRSFPPRGQQSKADGLHKRQHPLLFKNPQQENKAHAGYSAPLPIRRLPFFTIALFPQYVDIPYYIAKAYCAPVGRAIRSLIFT